MQRWIAALFGLAVLVGHLAAAGESRFFEAEAFDGLPYYGNWVDTKQWYIKRHYHASGGAFVVCHCKGPKMFKHLDEPLRPGTYQVCFRLVMNRSFRTKNVIRMALGSRDGKNKFKAQDGAEFVHDFMGSGYGWYTLPRPLTLKEPADTIEVAAMLVENKGIGDDPEYDQPYIILDGFIITDEQIEIVKEKNRGRNKLKFVTGTDPRQKAARIPYPRFGAPVHFDVLKERPAFVSSKNLLRNSGFELSLKPHYGGWGSMISGFNVDADCLCTDKPFHGNYCLEFTPKVANLLKDYTGSPETPIYGGALGLYAMGRFLKGEVNALRKEGPLVLSLYLRTNGKPVSFSVGQAAFKADHTEWKRYTGAFPKRWTGTNIFSFSTDDPAARVYIDAMQIERGKEPTPYTPLAGLEVGFQVNQICNIFYRDKSLPLELSAALAADQKAETLKVTYALYNNFLEKEANGVATIAATPGKVTRQAVNLPFNKLGVYLLVYDVEGHPEQGYAVPVYVVENPKAVPRNRMLGAIVSTNEEIMKLFHHAGFDWVNSLNDRTVYYDNLWPTPEALHPYDKYWDMWRKKYDIQYALWAVPFVHVPKWDPGNYGVEAAAHMGRKNMSYADWDRFWEMLTTRVKGVEVFIPVDELSYHRGPHDALPYVDIAARIIRKNRPDAKIMFSTQASHVLEMLKIKPDLDLGDAIGGSRHNMERNGYRYDRYVKDLTKKECWIVGVGWGGNSWYGPMNFETFAANQDNWQQRWAPRLNQVRRTLFDEASVIGIERYGAYVAKFDQGHDPCSFFTGDNSFAAFAIQFINTINFLREHKRGDVIHLDQADGVAAEYVMRAGKTCVMIYPTGAYAAVTLRLDVPADKVQCFDFNLNPTSFQSEVTLPIGKCLFVQDKGLGQEALLQAVQSMKALPLENERRLILPADKGLALTTWKQEAGGMKQVRSEALPADAGLRYPLDVAKGYNTYSWAMVAAKVDGKAIKLDGALNEPAWQQVAPSFMYCWAALDGSYGAVQGLTGFETVRSLSDISCTHRALWDGENVILAFDVLDDRVGQGDQIKVQIDADLLGDLGVVEPNNDEYVIVIAPGVDMGKSKTLAPDLLSHKGNKVGTCAAVVAARPGGYSVELQLPLAQIKVPANKPGALGIGIELTDQDGEETSVLNWTTNYAPRRSPRGYGQLVLVK